MELIHYGSSNYDSSLVKPIQNRDFVKPLGGLWTSPINSEWGWKDWCTSENFRECNQDNSFLLKLYDWCKICTIDSFQDLKVLPHIKVYDYREYLDFEYLSKQYDCIWLTYNGIKDTYTSRPGLYGWDCESVLILNPNCCYQL